MDAQSKAFVFLPNLQLSEVTWLSSGQEDANGSVLFQFWEASLEENWNMPSPISCSFLLPESWIEPWTLRMLAPFPGQILRTSCRRAYPALLSCKHLDIFAGPGGQKRKYLWNFATVKQT